MKTLERQIADYSALVEESNGPISVSELATQTATPRSKRAPGFVWLAAAALAVVLLIGLIPFVFQSGEAPPATEPPAVTVPPTVTVPEAVEPTEVSFSFVWTEIEGPTGSLPPSGFTWSETDGYVGIDNGGGLNQPTDPGVEYRWTSPDGISWEQETRAVSESALGVFAGDLEALADLLSVLVPDPGDMILDAVPTFGPIKSTEGAIIQPIHLRLTVPWHEIYAWGGNEPEWNEDLVTWDPGSETITVKRNDRSTAAVLAIEQNDESARLIDLATNEVIGVLHGSEALPVEHLTTAAMHGQLRLGAYLHSEDGEEWTFHLSPWPEEDFYWGMPINPSPSGGFTANVKNETDSSTSTWRSSDGITWTEVGRLTFLDSIASYIDVNVYPFANRLRADVLISEDAGDGYGETVSWESANGIDWAPAKEAFGDAPHVETSKTNFGWVASTWLYEGGYALWVSPDGTDWTPIEVPEEANQLRDGLPWAGGAGEIIYVSHTDDEATTLWVGHLDR